MIQIAHRGYSDKFGDNKIASFLQAIHSGFDMIEMDIQLCKTGDIVVFHDTYLNNRAIADYTLKELDEQNIITLKNVFETIKLTNSIKFFLDIKGNGEVIYLLIDMLRNYFSRTQLRRIFISGFNRTFVKPLLESKLPIRIGLTTSNLHEKEDLDYLTNNMNFVCLDWTALNHENIEMLHQKGIVVYSYTCENDYILQYMKQYKLDGIVTNYLL
jgi:glycerophosphoryl diester phosphodiesterase